MNTKKLVLLHSNDMHGDFLAEKKEDFDLERYIYDRKTDSFVKNDDYKASGINIATDYMKDIEYYNSGISSAIKVIDESSLDRVIQRMIYNTDYFSFTTDNIIGDLIYYDDKSFIIWSGYQMNYYDTEKMEHCTLYTNDIGSHPIVMDGDIFVTNGGGGIFCIKPDTGAIYTLFDNGGEAVRGNGSYYDVMNMSCLYDGNDGEGFIYTCYDYSKSRDGYTMIYLFLHQ